jgi:hypothetical protein
VLVVVVGGSGSYTDKFEVIGNVKANALFWYINWN